MFYNPYFYYMPRIPDINNNPPTVYSILNSIANYDKEEKIKTEDLAMYTHGEIFSFNYPLSNKVNKDNFETLILNRFLMRRIGFETVTAFKINLNVKMNTIMPKYNILFDSLIGWDIFNDYEKTIRTGTDKTKLENTTNTQNTTTNNQYKTDNTTLTGNTQTESENNNTVESNSNTTLSSENNSTTSATNTNNMTRKFSNLPQNQISEITDNNYMTDYTQENTTATNSGTDNSENSSESTNTTTTEGTDTTNTETTTNNTTTSETDTTNTINAENTEKFVGDNNKTYNEKIEKTLSPAEKYHIYMEMQQNLSSIYEMIFNDLQDLFYSIIN